MKLLILFLSLGLFLVGCKDKDNDSGSGGNNSGGQDTEAENQFPQVFDNQSFFDIVVSAKKATDDDKAIGDKDKEVAARNCEAFDKDAFTPGEDGAVYVYLKDGDNKGGLLSEYKATEKDFTEVINTVTGINAVSLTAIERVGATTKDAGDDPAACP